MKSKLNQFHLDNVQNFIGFAVETAGPGELVKVLTRGVFISDQPEFYTYTDEISSLFLNKIGIFINAVYKFLILIHENLSADIFVNDFPINIECRVKKRLQKGDILRSCDLADIGKLYFPKIQISENDKVIYCFKVGWKFGLFFDLARDKNKLNIDSMQSTLGELYRFLSFQYIYKFFESEVFSEELLADGWFPFVELIGSFEFRELLKSYQDKKHLEGALNNFIEKFKKERIENLVNKWWGKEIFDDKRDIILAGVKAFFQNEKDGYINCINTLFPQIEGIIRILYFKDKRGGKKIKIRKLLDFILERGKNISGSDYSLILAVPFVNYLKKFFFKNFDFRKW